MSKKTIINHVIAEFLKNRDPEDDLLILDKACMIVNATDPTRLGKSLMDARPIIKNKRTRFMVADTKGRMRDIRPLSVDDRVLGAYVIIAKIDRLCALSQLMEGILDKVDLTSFKEEEDVIPLDLNADIPFVNKEPNKKTFPRPKRTYRSRKEEENANAELNLNRAFFIRNSAHEVQNLGSGDLLRCFNATEYLKSSDGLVIFTSKKPVEEIDSIIEVNDLDVFASYDFEPVRKKAAVKALRALSFTPNPIRKNSVIYFEDNKTYATILLSYLDHPDLYLQDIQRLHHLERKNSLYTTFLAFVENNYSIKRTCERLQVHRNTICNRLKKVEEILKCPLIEGESSYKLFTLYVLITSLQQTTLPDISRDRSGVLQFHLW